MYPHGLLTNGGTRVMLGNFAVFVIVVVGTILYYVLDVPVYKSGFFCDDNSIKYPYKPNTIDTALSFVLTLGPAVLVIVIREAFHHGRRRRLAISRNQDWYGPMSASNSSHMTAASDGSIEKFSLWKVTFARLALQIHFLVFGFCLCASTTFMFKDTLGRLRPHFLDVCQPEPGSVNCSEGYVTTVKCTQTDHRLLKDARRSFVSGHSSQSFFFLVFVMLYLQDVMPSKHASLKTLLQAASLALACYIGVSRITDNFHHPSDVVFGAILGSFLAYFTAKYTVSVVTTTPHVDPKVLPLQHIRTT